MRYDDQYDESFLARHNIYGRCAIAARCCVGIHQGQVLHHHGWDGRHAAGPHDAAADLFALSAPQHGLGRPRSRREEKT